MLVISRVVDARRQDRDDGIVHPGGGDVAKHGQQVGSIIVDGPHVIRSEHQRKRLLHHLPVLEDVADPRRRAPIVLKNEETTHLVADQVDPRHMQVNVFGNAEADAFATVARGTQHELGGNHPVAEDLSIMVNVVDEEVQRADALFQTPLDAIPLLAGDDAWDRVERDDPLDAAPAAVNRERDALIAHQEVGRAMAAFQLLGPELAESIMERRVVRAGFSGRDEHLVEAGQAVMPEEAGLGPELGGHGDCPILRNRVGAGNDLRLSRRHRPGVLTGAIGGPNVWIGRKLLNGSSLRSFTVVRYAVECAQCCGTTPSRGLSSREAPEAGQPSKGGARTAGRRCDGWRKRHAPR